MGRDYALHHSAPRVERAAARALGAAIGRLSAIGSVRTTRVRRNTRGGDHIVYSVGGGFGGGFGGGGSILTPHIVVLKRLLFSSSLLLSRLLYET